MSTFPAGVGEALPDLAGTSLPNFPTYREPKNTDSDINSISEVGSHLSAGIQTVALKYSTGRIWVSKKSSRLP